MKTIRDLLKERADYLAELRSICENVSCEPYYCVFSEQIEYDESNCEDSWNKVDQLVQKMHDCDDAIENMIGCSDAANGKYKFHIGEKVWVVEFEESYEKCFPSRYVWLPAEIKGVDLRGDKVIYTYESLQEDCWFRGYEEESELFKKEADAKAFCDKENKEFYDS